MKHRITIPWADDDDMAEFANPLADFVRRCPGWSVTALTWETAPRCAHRPMLFLQLSPDFGLVAGITAYSGITIIYDDAEQSLGLTTVPEPQDTPPMRTKADEVREKDEEPPKRRVLRLRGRGTPMNAEPEDERKRS